jgi:hypothetical protein
MISGNEDQLSSAPEVEVAAAAPAPEDHQVPSTTEVKKKFTVEICR